jgi:hypothetical protein
MGVSDRRGEFTRKLLRGSPAFGFFRVKPMLKGFSLRESISDSSINAIIFGKLPHPGEKIFAQSLLYRNYKGWWVNKEGLNG